MRGERETDEPYLMRAADLRRRLRRLLAPPDAQSKRLNLRDRVRWIEYTVTGSEFESLLLLYDATAACFGVGVARKRLKLHTPYFLRLTLEHAHPRVYSTNRLSVKGLGRTGRLSLAQARSGTATRCWTCLSCGAAMRTWRCIRSIRVAPMVR